MRNVILKHPGHRLGEFETVGYVRQILCGLKYLHLKGIIHRDLKAGNLMFTSDGVVKLGDFGVSVKFTSPKEHSRSTTDLNGGSEKADDEITEDELMSINEPHGSPYWMSPEVIKLKGCSTKSDIWSLGATIVEMLTGKPPFYDYGPLPACHAIGNGEHIQLPGYLTNHCKSFLYDYCFVFEASHRADVDKLLAHKCYPPRNYN
ncbi:unnamed protein product [Ambrosiozyma monospora]|uniref:Unnamed protein product n=1 Tax=Ambrosiozyma monospora TaxID=43982 RepID=A0ACB5UD08_AMBMO|nr:unnamed protein product [Ambrosiozyma monospora]